LETKLKIAARMLYQWQKNKVNVLSYKQLEKEQKAQIEQPPLWKPAK
jgi:hypothetical protein